eukprot:TRINITY_DN4824_c1_g1_i2.p2 TRINITY_DN4824_c1_g1~~TRINITY_DN4824_c1_g1_i2.p2  ORF type:complete len:122 (-),score=11.48 TRINITY_DN4824_c1_g1_i2:179-544(-)
MKRKNLFDEIKKKIKKIKKLKNKKKKKKKNKNQKLQNILFFFCKEEPVKQIRERQGECRRVLSRFFFFFFFANNTQCYAIHVLRRDGRFILRLSEELKGVKFHRCVLLVCFRCNYSCQKMF